MMTCTAHSGPPHKCPTEFSWAEFRFSVPCVSAWFSLFSSAIIRIYSLFFCAFVVVGRCRCCIQLKRSFAFIMPPYIYTIIVHNNIVKHNVLNAWFFRVNVFLFFTYSIRWFDESRSIFSTANKQNKKETNENVELCQSRAAERTKQKRQIKIRKSTQKYLIYA